jgi:hypothetical protein
MILAEHLENSSGETCMEAWNPKWSSKTGGGMVGMEINLEFRRNLDAWPQ